MRRRCDGRAGMAVHEHAAVAGPGWRRNPFVPVGDTAGTGTRPARARHAILDDDEDLRSRYDASSFASDRISGRSAPT